MVPKLEKRYYSIGDLSKMSELLPHVLRYWEKKVPKLKPMKRNGRRYYSQQDVKQVYRIKDLISQGHTIEGVNVKLSEKPESSALNREVVIDVVAMLSQIVQQLEELSPA